VKDAPDMLGQVLLMRMIFQPAKVGVCLAVKLGDVGFDVEQRGSVEGIQPGNIDPVANDLLQFDDAQADRAWPDRCAAGKQADFDILCPGRADLHL